MKRIYLTLAILLSCLSTAQAQFYIGLPNSGIVANLTPAYIGGLTIGTYNLFGDFGIRATAQVGVPFIEPLTPFVEGSVDGTYSFGEEIIFYTGAGLGYSGYGEAGALTVAGFTGLDFDTNSVISLFLEIRPILYLGTGGTVQIRSGINFHIGGTTGGEDESDECCVIP
jgi:hypothetical protein